MKQMRFALSGCRFQIERRELWLFGGGHALRCVAAEHIGLTGDKGCKGQGRIKANRRGKARLANRACRNRNSAGIMSVISRATSIAEAQFGQLTASRVHLDAYFAHFTARDFPR